MKKHQVKFTYAFGEKEMWSLLFEKIDSDFAQHSSKCTMQGTQRRKKTELSLEQCDNGKKIYYATVFHKLSVSPKSFSTRSISVPIKISFL